ncbi:hypothetical protein [Janibacter cremeus]|uniref:Uncharacterized protein n=1 Tax=Janibacter cremeus TaxID=1285192 RepID=A0A852VR62_9MICO|nr:hypothetical protein [Janibacter cremeus]NYF98308.1 hypothetical protein [Janibacter cremeus]
MSAADETTTDTSPEPGGGVTGALGGAAHLAAWGFVFLILRIFAVSGYDWDTAFLVSTTLGIDDGLALMFGSLMAGHLVTSIVLVVVVPLLIAARLWGPPGHRPVVMLLTTVGLVTMLALTVSFRSWWLLPTMLVVLAAITVTRRLLRESSLRHLLIAGLARASWVAAVSALVVAAFVTTPWVPQETIETTEGIVTGHVLSVDSGYLNVLTDEQEFVIILTKDVLSRD